MWYIYIIKCYLVVMNNEIVMFVGKWMKLDREDLENFKIMNFWKFRFLFYILDYFYCCVIFILVFFWVDVNGK